MDMFSNGNGKKQLRPHQVKAIEMLRQSLGRGNKRVVLQAPTGFGKTLTAANIIALARGKGIAKKVMFTVPRIALVDQAIADFAAEGIFDVGVIQGNHPRTDPDATVQIASVQTLGRRDIPNEFGLVIVDECHETFKVIFDLMDRWPNTFFVGLSATPWAVGMANHWQDLCVATTIGELIENGYLSKFVAFAPDVPDLSGVKVIAGEYAEEALSKVMGDSKLMGSVVQTWLAKGGNRPTFCFGVNRIHAQTLRDQFLRAGISAGYCDAHTDQVEMHRLKRDFVSGEIRVMCSVRKMTTGIDWPVSCIIDAAPTQSEMLHVQKIGRGLRINPGTEDLLILDHAGNSLRLGLVTDIFHDRLAKGDKKAKDGKKRDKLPTPCPSCETLFSGLRCPSCGHEKKPVSKITVCEGDLVQLSGKMKPPTQAEKQAWWSGLLWIANNRGYKRGWAWHTYKDKFGVSPTMLLEEARPPTQEIENFVRHKMIRNAKRRTAGDAARQNRYYGGGRP